MRPSFVELAGADSIETTATKVANHIESTTDSSDMFERLTQNGTTPLSGLGDKFYSKGSPEFLSSRRIPIPGELQMQMTNVHGQFSMGFFTPINRVWVVIDNNLYMWNYEKNDDLAFFESETTIMKVALVSIKKSVFEPCVTHGLVIGTISDISLYPVVQASDAFVQLAIDRNRFFRVNLEGATVGDVTYTNSGRIFYTAGEQLFEFVYEKQVGWFSTGHKCRSVKQSASLFETLIHIPFFSSAKEDLEQISLDRSRNILYCLGKNGTITVFDLGGDGNECRKVCSISSGQIAHEAHLLTQFGHDDSTFKNITSVTALEARQSNKINLVAVTVRGVRLYFSVLAKSLQNNNAYGQNHASYVSSKILHQSDVRPQCLRVAHVRFSPGVAPTSIYGEGPQGVTVTYLNETICVMASANRNLVWGLSNYFYPSSRIFCESMTEMNVPGHVWQIECVDDPKVRYLEAKFGQVDRVRPQALYRQPTEERSRLLICSNQGVYEFTQMNSVDALREALFDGSVEGKATTKLMHKLGFTEMLILSLQILASDLPIDERIKHKAEQILHGLKDAPELVEGDRTFFENSTWSPVEASFTEWKQRVKSPLLSSTPRGESHSQITNPYLSPFSPSLNLSVTGGDPSTMRMLPSRRHDALYYYFSRLTMPVWNHSICQVVNGKQLDTTFDPETMELLAMEIKKFGAVIDEYRLVPSLEYSGYSNNTPERLSAEASSLERLSLVGLRRLIDATVETLMLWVLAKKCNLGAISAGMDPAILPTFASRKLAQMVAESHSLNGELIRAMIKYFLGDEAGTTNLSESLRNLCPTLYSEDDACVTNGMEQLEAAKKVSGATRRRLVTAAVNMFKKSIAKVALGSTCQQLAEKVGAYEEIVELCLLRASKDDPKQLALLEFYNKQSKGVESAEIRAAEQKRSGCYRVITDELDRLEAQCVVNSIEVDENIVNRDVMLAAALKSEDQLAHFAIFRWLLDKNKTSVVLQSHSPYIELFLCHEINAGRGQKYFDLLWRFYEKSGNYKKAAVWLSKLAENENWTISLSQRCSYISHAVMCAQASNDATLASGIDELRDKLDVAGIQNSIKDTLESAGNRELAKKLDGPILTLQDLLVRYVVPHKLHKLKLAVFHCANMYLEEHILETWDNIIQEEFMTSNDEVTLCENLLCTLTDLQALYKDTKYFPRDVIIQRILEIGCGVGVNRQLLPSAFFSSLCKRLGIPLISFLKLLADEFRGDKGDAWWTENEGGQFYISQVVLHITRLIVHEVEVMPPSPRKAGIARECNAQLVPFIRRACDVGSSTRLQTIGDELTILQGRIRTCL